MRNFVRIALIFILFSFFTSLHAYKPEELKGRWLLRYKDGFGYEFRLKENYRAYVVLYLQGQVLVFKGVYNVDQENILRINISEMKDMHNSSAIESVKDLVKTSSSLFRFTIETFDKKNLVIVPLEIRIDGRRSDGYFEKRLPLALVK